MLTGVYKTTKKDGTTYYRAGINFKNKHISLGSSPSQQTAAEMYREAKNLLTDFSITLTDFSSHIHALSFEKAICLLNYRDHGIYIKTPIYLQTGFFLYYIEPASPLKFDNDDLFYYSSHKIIRRNGHLFVNDYGMQYNIANRYGIKNYGVEGRDFRFANGDSSDFRYSNIIIINKYHGITQELHNNKTWYVAKLHLNGDVIIGKYSSEVKAAVAYNKGVDFARDQGIEKNYIENFVSELSPKEYADLYTRLPLSNKFKEYILKK